MNIGILNAYQSDPSPDGYQTEYAPMLRDYITKVNAALQKNLRPKFYNVALEEFPEKPRDNDAWLITGSPRSCYEDERWIKWLKDFVVKCYEAQVPVIGICFGHQLIAEALGGKVEKQKNWGIGVQPAQLATEFATKQKLTEMNLLYSHQDQVTKLPRGARLLATSSYSANMMYVIDKNIFCLQGHPEFTKQFAQKRLLGRKDIIEAENWERAMGSLSNITDELLIGQWMVEFLESCLEVE